MPTVKRMIPLHEKTNINRNLSDYKEEVGGWVAHRDRKSFSSNDKYIYIFLIRPCISPWAEFRHHSETLKSNVLLTPPEHVNNYLLIYRRLGPSAFC